MNLGYCPRCGALDARYTGGGNPYNQNCAEVKCNKCGYTSSLHVFRDARPPSRKMNAEGPSTKKQEQKQEQSLSEKIAYEYVRIKRLRLEFEQDIEKKKLEFEQDMQRMRETFKQDLEEKKLVFQLKAETEKQSRKWDWGLLVPVLGISGMFLMLALVIICR